MAKQRKKWIVEWNIPDSVSREKYEQAKIDSLDIYPEVEGVEWKTTFLSDSMDKCYCVYEAEDEEAVKRAREAVNAPIDAMFSVEELDLDAVLELKNQADSKETAEA